MLVYLICFILTVKKWQPYGITFVVIRGVFFTVYKRKQAQLTASKL